jgi:alpha-aminoadipic semialdehyde synthase
MVGTRGVVGIRRENKSMWERRCPLVPEDVKVLIDSGIRVLVQPSPIRCYSDQAYQQVGAELSEDLSSANVILGIKEVGMEYLQAGQTYVMFAHVAKAQPYNMPLLDKLMELGVRVIDYEYIQEAAPPRNRLIAFGRFAGIGGVIDYFRGLGLYLLKRNISSPFLYMGSSYMYPDITHAKEAVKTMGAMIATEGLPASLTPMVFGVAGSGRVGQGAWEILQLLPHTVIPPERLSDPEVYTNASNQVFITMFTEEHMAERTDGGVFNLQEYYKSPELYKGVFADRYLRYLSVLVNCIFYDLQYPKLLSLETMRNYVLSGQNKFLGTCDISCDKKGAIEYTRKFTDPQTPWFLYNVLSDCFHEVDSTHCSDSLLHYTLDFIPSEFARDSSQHFSKININFAKVLAWDDPTLPYEESSLPGELKEAAIVWHGKLTPRFQYIPEMKAKRIPAEAQADTLESRICAVLKSHPDLSSDLIQVQNSEPASSDLKAAIQELSRALGN